jgi:hypothetical protein
MANQKTFNNAKKTNQTKTLYNSSRLVLNQNIIHPKLIGCIQLPVATLNKSLGQQNLQVFRSIEPMSGERLLNAAASALVFLKDAVPVL